MSKDKDILRGLGETDALIENARLQYTQARTIYEGVIQYGPVRESVRGLDFKRLSLKKLLFWQHQLTLTFGEREYNIVLKSTPAPSLMEAQIDILAESGFGHSARTTLLPVSSIGNNGHGRIGTLTPEQAEDKLGSLMSLTHALKGWLDEQERPQAQVNL